MNDKIDPLGFILVGERPKFPDKKSEVAYYLEAILSIEIFIKMGNVLAMGVYDIHHQLRVTPLPSNEFIFWDEDTFEKIEDIISNSPKSAVDTIYFQISDAACVVIPIRPGTYLILLCNSNHNVELHLAPKWRRQILNLVQQLDDIKS